ncbi:hypothetical protein LRP49_06035 [Enterovibrio sp. ZSDZ35]|uniref:Uncharacterized protein n=1 Tax=Enterovibrio qingdaonensis TaxID=2899818 RepID=A0ABT5QIE8_9GAMM|nr:hypothetical protein [Enterovibrio sp. ZSDZ35]MDD1780761.1 hypothetical protein [Enterovibrio sp. ZSDZ35]
MKKDEDFYAWKTRRAKGQFDYIVGDIVKDAIILSIILSGISVFFGVDVIVSLLMDSYYWIAILLLAYPMSLLTWHYKEHQFRKECVRRNFEFTPSTFFKVKG